MPGVGLRKPVGARGGTVGVRAAVAHRPSTPCRTGSIARNPDRRSRVVVPMDEKTVSHGHAITARETAHLEGYTMNRTIATLATVAALGFGGAAVAQTTMTMGEGYDMLQTALMNDFTALGIETTELEGLTLGQIAAIKGIVESEESDSNKKASIDAIIAQE